MKHDSRQLHLRIHEPDEEPSLRCRGLFSLSYLRHHLARSEHFPSVQEAQPLYDKLKARWLENLPGLRKRKEAYTRTQFLDPTLRDLGWWFIPEQDLPAATLTRKRPDYCLFADGDAQQRAAKQDNPTDILRHSASVLEAKKVGHSLDRVSEEETPGWYPSQQIQDYLRAARDATGQRFFDWAILTNGNEWRLYCEQAPADAYFAFHLADEQQFCSLEDFRFFLALFRPAAFLRAQGRCLLDDIRENSLTLQATLETNLRKRIFDVLEDLATAYWKHPDNQITPAGFKRLYDTALIFLYRLLFVLYAESRDLLPAKPSGPGANKRYREQFSLARLVGKLRDRTSFPSDDFTELYEDLLKLFHLINGDRPRQNEACNVTRYNGGLFDPKQHPEIEKWRVGDRALANVLRQLIFAQPPARPSAPQQQISTEEAIDYSTLEVRQLGDIYEGLLGAELREQDGRLVLVNENGENHRHGIYYTPDWVVRFLVRESLQPLVDEIQARPEVRRALQARSEEKRRDNSFALAVLQLNLVDPAMGSGHFLVRATEWLADQILDHPTTRHATEQIVAHGDRRRSREDILKAGKIPVPPGISQRDAEKAYWRRRVVEACIYGVDINPLAVELAKLSLWLTCIAVDEPLNFLDHHLRVGNSLLFAQPDELRHLRDQPAADDKQVAFDIGDHLQTALAHVIETNVNIETTASTEMEIVKAKEQRWKKVRAELDPFLDAAHLWLAALDGLSLNDLQYRLLVLGQVAPDQLDPDQRKEAAKLRKSLAEELDARRRRHAPFHWQLEFPDVFFQPDGRPRPEAERGFDCYLGNPPYISTHTSAEQAWRNLLEKRAGYLEDLYLHFTDLGFQLLRPGGTLGFIVSDTFFTLNSKLRMREWLQRHTLTHLGQCDPFEATVDAAIFVARKGSAGVSPADSGVTPESVSDQNRNASGGTPDAARETRALPEKALLFIQARPRRENGRLTDPERDLPALKPLPQLTFNAKTALASLPAEVEHGTHGCLRLHRVPLDLYRTAHKRVFFEPRPATLRLFDRFNEPVKRLHAEWWDKIETSQKFAENLPAIRAYHRTLKPGDITLVGLIAEGGQGMRTANNARFLGYLEGTPQADAIKAKRETWTQRWLADPKIKPVFVALLKQHGGNPARPTANSAAWEACVEPLKQQFSLAQLGFSKSDLYRIVPKELVATKADFQFAWQRRKAQLLEHWRGSPDLKPFRDEMHLVGRGGSARQDWLTGDLSDADFCALCQDLLRWFEEQRKAGRKLSRDILGLRSSENYTDPADAPRIATIYNGLSGRGQFVPFRKGDPTGNRWLDNEPLFIDWSACAVTDIQNNPKSRWQGQDYFFLEGVSWTRGANHVPIKAKWVVPAVMDVNAMKLSPIPTARLAPPVLLAVFNSDVFSYFLKKFVDHTWMVQISDIRSMPFVIPTGEQAVRLVQLAEWAMAAKRLSFENAAPPNDLVAALRQLAAELTAHAPAYLRPPAQELLLVTPADCLAIIERAVHWEAEKLYGVEGAGPLDEF